jgi:hypothetical protein
MNDRPRMITINTYKYQDIINFFKENIVDYDNDIVHCVSTFYSRIDNGNNSFAQIQRPCIGTLHSLELDDNFLNDLKENDPIAYKGYKILVQEKFIGENDVFFMYETP